MRRIPAELVHRLTDLQPSSDLTPIVLGAADRYTLARGPVEALDEQLRVRRRRAVEVPENGSLLTATPDLTTLVFGGYDEMVVYLDDQVLRIAIQYADTAVLLGDGRMIVTAQGIGWPGGGHFVHLVDLRTGAVVDSSVLDVTEAMMITMPHPHDGSVLIDAGLGQDGSITVVARADGDRLSVEPMLRDAMAAGFDPSGDRLLLTPHPASGDGASVVRWPSLRTVARLNAEDLSMFGCFLSDDRIVVQTRERGLLVCTADLTPMARLDLDFPVETVLGAGPDLIVAEVWTGEATTAAVWRVPR